MLLAEIGWATSALHFVPKPQQHTNLFSSASRKKLYIYRSVRWNVWAHSNPTRPHTCSEQSLRILMWNASYVQKHSIKPDRKSMETRSEKNLEVCISTSLLDANRSLPDIKFGFKIVWKRHAGSWLSRLPLTKNWKIAGTFSQEHCSVFVGRWLQCSPAAPCLKWNEIMPTKIWEVYITFSRARRKMQKDQVKSEVEVLHFTSFQMVHTHTHPPAGGCEI